MSTMTYPQVLQEAQQLPPVAQLQLAETLLHNMRGLFAAQSAPPETEPLSPLFGMNREELRTLSDSVVAPDRQQRLQTLLEKNRQGTLTAEESSEVDALLEETDQAALLKARARYTLRLFDQIEQRS